MRKSQFLLFKV